MKRLRMLIVGLLVVMLAGCAATNGTVEKMLLQKSGVAEDEDYQEYQRLMEENKLDEEGYYAGWEGEENGNADEELAQGTVHVTFADNRYLRIDYYKDAELTQPIREDACYLEPGDCIYAAEPESTNPYSNMYKLLEFRVYE